MALGTQTLSGASSLQWQDTEGEAALQRTTVVLLPRAKR